MNKNNVIRSQQWKFMLYNLIAFTLFFAIFGMIIFSQIKAPLFAKTDADLRAYRDMFVSGPGGAPMKGGAPPRAPRIGSGGEPLNPRFIPIDWDINGNIINKQQLGLYYEVFQDMKFDDSTLQGISTVTIKGTYHFRTLSFPNPAKPGVYTQLLVNVDAEQNLMNHFKEIIIVCSVIFILLSISASFILSRQTMKPIIRSWNRQAEFVENASHELRTPLTVIQNKLELLLTTPDKRIVDTFENIALSLSETRRLSRLTTDLLTLARADSTETQLEKKPVELDKFIGSVCTPYIEIAELQDKHVWLQLGSEATVQADPARLHQLMVILLDNALKYTGSHDSIGISTYVKENRVYIEVSDSGIGISEEAIGRIFDRFYRADPARSREHDGSGLGLSIAQWIVQSHHGTIHAHHNEPKGMIIRIRLPR